ncbi:MAG: hypothetical protein ACRC46_08210 [Thermoguttaceae bacterium]
MSRRQKRLSGGAVLLTGIGMLFCGGCDPVPEAPKAPVETTSRPFWDEKTPDAKPQRVVELPPPTVKAVAEIVAVKLSAADEATCKVRVGDVFPESPNVPRGKPTLVAFWPSSDKPIDKLVAEEMLTSIPAILTKAGATDAITFVPLDATQEATLFAAVAQDAKPPRIFLLDAAGKVLWFDTEFSVATSDAIEQAARFVAQNPQK